MSALLRRQFAKLQLSEEKPPDIDQWRAFVAHVRRTYVEAENDRYTLERSMMISSREMQDLYNTLRRSEENFRVVAERIPDGVIVHQDGLIRYANRAMASLLAIDYNGELIGKDAIETLVHPDDKDATYNFVRRRTAGETDGTLRIRWVRGNGSTIFVECRSTEITFDNRPATLVIAHDITAHLHAQDERERMAEILRENEMRFRTLFESGILAITIAHPSGGISEANDTFLDMLGYCRDDLVAGTVSRENLTPSEWRHLHVGVREQLKAVGRARPWEQEYLHKDGTRVPVLVGVATLDGERNISFSIDLSEQKRAEARKSAVMDHALDAIVGMDHLGRITEFNPAAEETFGYLRPEVLGKPLAQVLVPLRLRDAHRQGVAHYLATDPDAMLGRRVELTGLRQDGSEIAIELAIARVGADGPPSFIAFIRDISARKRSDQAKAQLEEQLRQSQKMEAVGSFAGGVAHDFNNLLCVILSYSATLSGDLETTDPIRSDINEIHTAGLRASELTRQLLAFSRRQMLQPRVVDLNEILDGMERMLRRLIREDVELTLLRTPCLSRTKVDPGQIEQVIMNLAINARDAMPDGGNLTFETSNIRLDEEYARAHPGVGLGNYVLLTVSDTGMGMDSTTRSRIFEPFFTTKEKGKGTGLGLATVFGIVKQSQGHISVESEPEKGTTFKIYLPRASTTSFPAETRVSLRPAPSSRNKETILLVEDNDQVRAVARGILHRAGYVVIEASNGGEALLACEQHEAQIDLLLTDVVLPRMGGRRLAQRLSAMRPEMKVLFMSGHTDDAALQLGVLESSVAYLQKPFTPGSLTRKVHEVLLEMNLTTAAT